MNAGALNDLWSGSRKEVANESPDRSPTVGMAIIHAGKNVENRPWRTHFRGRLCVHAGLQLYELGIDSTENNHRLEVPDEDDLEFGAIIGTVELHDVADSRSPWAIPGQCYWLLRNPRPLKRPIPVSGRQGLGNYEKEARAA